jgi:hypothetical protein
MSLQQNRRVSFSDMNRSLTVTNGNTGIGTTAPAHMLDVNGGMRSINFTTTSALITNVTTGTLNASTGITAATAQITNINATTISTGTAVSTTYTGGSISLSGAVTAVTGTIGTFAATTSSAGTAVATTYTGGSMSLSGNLSIGGTLTTVNITTTNISETNVSAGSVSATNIGVTTQTVGTSRITTSLLALGNSNTVGNIFTTGGNVGIGITNPSEALSVSGNIRLGPTTDSDTDYYIKSAGQLSISANDASSQNTIYTSLLLNSGVSPNQSIINLAGSSIAKYITISTANTERLRIDASGNVGIGTASPGSSLHVAGSIPVSPVGSGVHLGIDSNTYAAIQLNSTVGSYIDFGTSGGDYQARIIANTAGNIGIGAAGSAQLSVSHDFTISANSGAWNSTAGKGIFMRYSTNGGQDGAWIQSIDRSTGILYPLSLVSKEFNIETNNVSRIFASSTGNIGIGTTAPSGMLHLNNVALFTSSGNLTCTGDIISFGSLSDRRLKKNIETIETQQALDVVKKLRSVTFDWNDDVFNESKRNTHDIGFIAQEVEDIVPEAVSEYTEIESGNVYKRIKHERLVPYLLKAIQYLLDK